jgi:cell division protein FtsA
VQDLVLEPLASAEAVISAEEKELGILLIDLGGGTTDVALFRDGAVWHTGSLPLGGDHISNDIAVGLRTPTADAEELKKRHGCALTALVREDEVVDVPSVGGRKARQLSRQILSEIIQPRVEEIFELVKDEIHKTGYDDLLASGAVITGGTTILEGVAELGEEVLGLPVRRAMPKGVGGLVDVVRSPMYSTGVGLVLYGVHHGEVDHPQARAGVRGVFRRMADWFREVR